jgi:hypothetical protein
LSCGLGHDNPLLMYLWIEKTTQLNVAGATLLLIKKYA